jgi:23S rRNA pseudouridine1911/1915/1917 synthase
MMNENRAAGNSSFRKRQNKEHYSSESDLVIYKDRFFCLVNKPAGVPSQSRNPNLLDIVQMAANALGLDKKQLFLVNRLDQPVSGLIILARSSVVHAAFAGMQQKGLICKIYLAVIEGLPCVESGHFENYLLRDGRNNISKITKQKEAGSKLAKLDWRRLAVNKDQKLSLLSIELGTGRHHQIRVQLSDAGWPIWGDRKYGSKFLPEQQADIALFSQSLSFKHPITGTQIKIELPLPNRYPFNLFKSDQESFQTGK